MKEEEREGRAMKQVEIEEAIDNIHLLVGHLGYISSSQHTPTSE